MAGGIFGLGAVTGPLLGPTVGGWLIDVSSWHWIFLVNLPVGILAAGLAYRFIEEPGYKRPDVPVDSAGIGLLAVGMASLQYVLEEGNREGWTRPRSASSPPSPHRARHLLRPRAGDARSRRRSPRLREQELHGGHGINFLLGIALFSARTSSRSIAAR